MHVRNLERTRVRISERIEQPVAVSVPVVRHVAEVTAVAEVRCAARKTAQPLVCEVPDESALEGIESIGKRPEVREPACRVPHRVGVFALYERHLGTVRKILAALVGRAVHRTVDVRRPASVFTSVRAVLVLNRT